jgi:hypothetical protein
MKRLDSVSYQLVENSKGDKKKFLFRHDVSQNESCMKETAVQVEGFHSNQGYHTRKKGNRTTNYSAKEPVLEIACQRVGGP